MLKFIFIIIHSILEFLPVSSSNIIVILNNYYNSIASKFYPNLQVNFHMDILSVVFLHFIAGFAGIIFFYKDIIDIFKHRSKMLFFSCVFGSAILISGILYLIFAMDFLYMRPSPGPFLWLNHIIHCILLNYMIKKSSSSVYEEPRTIENIIYGLLGGVGIIVGFVNGLSRMGVLLVIFSSIMDLRKNYKNTIIISSIINVLFGSVILIKERNIVFTSGGYNIFVVMGVMVISSIISLLALRVFYNNVKRTLQLSNWIKFIIYGFVLFKSLNLMERIRKTLEYYIPISYISYAYIFVGAIIGSSVLSLLGINYIKDETRILFSLVLGAAVSVLTNIIIYFGCSSNFLSTKKDYNYYSSYLPKSRILTMVLALTQRFIPFARFPVIILCSHNLNFGTFFLLEVISSSTYAVIFYKFHDQLNMLLKFFL